MVAATQPPERLNVRLGDNQGLEIPSISQAENALAPRPRQRVRHHPGGEIHGSLGPVHVDRVISQKHRLMHQQGKGSEHGGHQDRVEAGLHAGQDGNARRDEPNPGRITPPGPTALSN